MMGFLTDHVVHVTFSNVLNAKMLKKIDELLHCTISCELKSVRLGKILSEI